MIRRKVIMRKRINKYTIIYGLILFVVALILESLIQFKFSWIYSVSYIIGLFTGLFNLMITDFGLSKLEFSMESKPKIYFTLLHIVKFVIYGIILFLSAYLFGYYTLFTCAFGMLFHKIIIYYLYIIKDPKDDKKRTVDSLRISKEIVLKLKYNDFFKVDDITNVNRERLLQFLTEDEVEKVIKSLKEYELFIKGELEAIIEDDKSFDV